MNNNSFHISIFGSWKPDPVSWALCPRNRSRPPNDLFRLGRNTKHPLISHKLATTIPLSINIFSAFVLK